MILSLGSQAKLFFITVLAGMAMGLFYDCFKVLRIAFKHENIIIQLEDIFYWLTVIFLIFFFMMHENFGEIRLFSICGVFLGMIIYFLTISKPIMMLSDAIIRAIKYILMLFIRIILTPFWLIWLIIRKPVKMTGNFIDIKSKKLLQICKVCVKINKHRFIRQFKFLRRVQNGKKNK